MKKLPKFKLKLINGEEIKSSKLKKTILFFYPKAFTSGCTIEVCDFQSHFKKFKKLGFQLIGVSKDSIFSTAKINFSIFSSSLYVGVITEINFFMILLCC